MEDYTVFRSKVLKLGPHKFKIRNSYTMKNIWRWYKKGRNNPVSERMFGGIVKSVNLALLDKMLEGSDIRFPKGMGKLELRKYKTKVKLVDGKIETNYPIDWDATLKLWHSDEESRKRKMLVRAEPKAVFKTIYSKRGATYKNKRFYKFTTARSLKKKISSKVSYNELDAFLI